MTTDNEAVIDLEGLGVRFGRLDALLDLRASVSGRAIGLLGPNGSGKTTLIHTLLGFHKPRTGSAKIFGHDIGANDRWIRRLVGYMPESEAYIPGMTGIHFVRMMGELSGLPSGTALERAHEALFYVGLGEARYRPLDGYSLGMMQRAKLAQSLVHGPKLIFLDEPTNGLDPPARLRMLELIKQIRDSGQARIIFSSHLLRDVEEVCDKVLVLKQGRIATYCDLEEERQANRKFLEIETRGDDGSFAGAAEELGCEVAVSGKRRLKMVLPKEIEIRQLYELAAARSMQIRRLTYKRDSLQDIFLKAMENDHGGT